jgi:hypothetical protein
MNFYYRLLPDGRCEVVCTRCFLTIGAAHQIEDVQALENGHQCMPARIPAIRPPAPAAIRPAIHAHWRLSSSLRPLLSVTNAIGTPRLVRNSLLLMGATLFLYIMPNAFEFLALRHWNPWISTVLPGDFLGCAILCIAFRKIAAGISLYCLLTAFEACALVFHIIPLGVLPWFTDLIPTVVVAVMVLRSAEDGPKLVSIS